MPRAAEVAGTMARQVCCCKAATGDNPPIPGLGPALPAARIPRMRTSTAVRTVLASRIAIVGQGRMGQALAGALARSGIEVDSPRGRGATGENADLVILAVPDAQIEAAAALIVPGRLVGHCSGSMTLEPLEPHEAFSIH